MIDFTKIKDLSRNPELKAQLANYCIAEYGENAVIDDFHLLAEYDKLRADNELERLFLQEQMNFYFNSLRNV